MKGTYKRDYEGDFLCTEEAVRAMFADQRDVSGDVEVLDEFGLDVLNQDTIKGYRIIFEQLYQSDYFKQIKSEMPYFSASSATVPSSANFFKSAFTISLNSSFPSLKPTPYCSELRVSGKIT